MASLPLCAACRRAVRVSSPSSQLPFNLEKHPPRLCNSSFATMRRYATPTAAPYQQKPAVNSGNESDPSPTSPKLSKPKAVSKPSSNPTHNMAKSLRETLPVLTETYVAYGSCGKLVRECARQAEYRIPQASEEGVELPKLKDGVQVGVGDGWWYKNLGLNPTFETWAQVTFLHMYILTVRLRCFPAEYVQPWHQHLIDHFSYMAEDKMAVDHKMVTRSERQKHLKDLFVKWRGLQTGYDEGLVKGDPVMATAVWRNIFQADPNVDWMRVGEVVSYIRHILSILGDMSDAEIACGDLAFGGTPSSEREGVLLRARGMDAKGSSESPTTASNNSSGPSPAKGRMMPEAGR